MKCKKVVISMSAMAWGILDLLRGRDTYEGE